MLASADSPSRAWATSALRPAKRLGEQIRKDLPERGAVGPDHGKGWLDGDVRVPGREQPHQVPHHPCYIHILGGSLLPGRPGIL